MTKRLEFDGSNIHARCYRGFALENEGDQAAAARDYAEVLRLEPKHAEMHMGSAVRAGEAGYTDIQIREFTIALRLAPRLATAYAGRANAHRDQGNAQQAVTDCDQAILLDPQNAVAYAIRGSVHLDTLDYDKAIADCTESIRLEPKLGRAYAYRGHARFGKGDVEGAVADCTKAIRLEPTDVLAYLGRARGRMRQRDFPGAVADCTQAMQLDPAWSATYLHRGNAFLGMGRYEEAVTDLTDAIRLSPLPIDYRARCYRARAYRASGRDAEAGADEREVLETSRELLEQARGTQETLTPAQVTGNAELVANVVHLGPAAKFTARTGAGGISDWSPDGQRVAFLKERRAFVFDDRGARLALHDAALAELWIARADGSEARGLTKGLDVLPADELCSASTPRWSPDGETIAYLAGTFWGPAMLLDIATGESTELGYSATAIRWAPDSRSLAFVGCRQEAFGRPDRQLYVAIAGVDGQTFHRITEVSDAEIGGWSPDGTQLLYTAWQSPADYAEWTRARLDESQREGCELWVARLDGSRPRRVATHVAGSGMWLPDGQWIAYLGDTSEPGLWRMNLATGDRQCVVQEPVCFAQWVHGGAILLYLRQESDMKTDLYLLQTRDGQKHQVTTSGNVADVQASPDGKRALITAWENAEKGTRCDTYLLTLKRKTGL